MQSFTSLQASLGLDPASVERLWRAGSNADLASRLTKQSVVSQMAFVGKSGNGGKLDASTNTTSVLGASASQVVPAAPSASEEVAAGSSGQFAPAAASAPSPLHAVAAALDSLFASGENHGIVRNSINTLAQVSLERDSICTLPGDAAQHFGYRRSEGTCDIDVDAAGLETRLALAEVNLRTSVLFNDSMVNRPVATHGARPFTALPHPDDLAWAVGIDNSLGADVLQLCYDLSKPDASLTSDASVTGRLRKILTLRDRRNLMRMMRADELIAALATAEAGVVASASFDSSCCSEYIKSCGAAATEAGIDISQMPALRGLGSSSSSLRATGNSMAAGIGMGTVDDELGLGLDFQGFEQHSSSARLAANSDSPCLGPSAQMSALLASAAAGAVAGPAGGSGSGVSAIGGADSELTQVVLDSRTGKVTYGGFPWHQTPPGLTDLHPPTWKTSHDDGAIAGTAAAVATDASDGRTDLGVLVGHNEDYCVFQVPISRHLASAFQNSARGRRGIESNSDSSVAGLLLEAATVPAPGLNPLTFGVDADGSSVGAGAARECVTRTGGDANVPGGSLPSSSSASSSLPSHYGPDHTAYGLPISTPSREAALVSIAHGLQYVHTGRGPSDLLQVDASDTSGAAGSSSGDVDARTTAVDTAAQVPSAPSAPSTSSSSVDDSIYSDRLPGLRVVGIACGSPAGNDGLLRAHDVIIGVSAPSHSLSAASTDGGAGNAANAFDDVFVGAGAGPSMGSSFNGSCSLAVVWGCDGASGSQSSATSRLPTQPSPALLRSHSMLSVWNQNAFASAAGGTAATSGYIIVARPRQLMLLESVIRDLPAATCALMPWPVEKRDTFAQAAFNSAPAAAAKASNPLSAGSDGVAGSAEQRSSSPINAAADGSGLGASSAGTVGAAIATNSVAGAADAEPAPAALSGFTPAGSPSVDAAAVSFASHSAPFEAGVSIPAGSSNLKPISSAHVPLQPNLPPISVPGLSVRKDGKSEDALKDRLTGACVYESGTSCWYMGIEDGSFETCVLPDGSYSGYQESGADKVDPSLEGWNVRRVHHRSAGGKDGGGGGAGHSGTSSAAAGGGAAGAEHPVRVGGPGRKRKDGGSGVVGSAALPTPAAASSAAGADGGTGADAEPLNAAGDEVASAGRKRKASSSEASSTDGAGDDAAAGGGSAPGDGAANAAGDAADAGAGGSAAPTVAAVMPPASSRGGRGGKRGGRGGGRPAVSNPARSPYLGAVGTPLGASSPHFAPTPMAGYSQHGASSTAESGAVSDIPALVVGYANLGIPRVPPIPLATRDFILTALRAEGKRSKAHSALIAIGHNVAVQNASAPPVSSSSGAPVLMTASAAMASPASTPLGAATPAAFPLAVPGSPAAATAALAPAVSTEPATAPGPSPSGAIVSDADASATAPASPALSVAAVSAASTAPASSPASSSSFLFFPPLPFGLQVSDFADEVPSAAAAAESSGADAGDRALSVWRGMVVPETEKVSLKGLTVNSMKRIMLMIGASIHDASGKESDKLTLLERLRMLLEAPILQQHQAPPTEPAAAAGTAAAPSSSVASAAAAPPLQIPASPISRSASSEVTGGFFVSSAGLGPSSAAAVAPAATAGAEQAIASAAPAAAPTSAAPAFALPSCFMDPRTFPTIPLPQREMIKNKSNLTTVFLPPPMATDELLILSRDYAHPDLLIAHPKYEGLVARRANATSGGIGSSSSSQAIHGGAAAGGAGEGRAAAESGSSGDLAAAAGGSDAAAGAGGGRVRKLSTKMLQGMETAFVRQPRKGPASAARQGGAGDAAPNAGGGDAGSATGADDNGDGDEDLGFAVASSSGATPSAAPSTSSKRGRTESASSEAGPSASKSAALPASGAAYAVEGADAKRPRAGSAASFTKPSIPVETIDGGDGEEAVIADLAVTSAKLAMSAARSGAATPSNAASARATPTLPTILVEDIDGDDTDQDAAPTAAVGSAADGAVDDDAEAGQSEADGAASSDVPSASATALLQPKPKSVKKKGATKAYVGYNTNNNKKKGGRRPFVVFAATASPGAAGAAAPAAATDGALGLASGSGSSAYDNHVAGSKGKLPFGSSSKGGGGKSLGGGGGGKGFIGRKDSSKTGVTFRSGAGGIMMMSSPGRGGAGMGSGLHIGIGLGERLHPVKHALSAYASIGLEDPSVRVKYTILGRTAKCIEADRDGDSNAPPTAADGSSTSSSAASMHPGLSPLGGGSSGGPGMLPLDIDGPPLFKRLRAASEGPPGLGLAGPGASHPMQSPRLPIGAVGASHPLHPSRASSTSSSASGTATASAASTAAATVRPAVSAAVQPAGFDVLEELPDLDLGVGLGASGGADADPSFVTGSVTGPAASHPLLSTVAPAAISPSISPARGLSSPIPGLQVEIPPPPSSAVDSGGGNATGGVQLLLTGSNTTASTTAAASLPSANLDTLQGIDGGAGTVESSSRPPSVPASASAAASSTAALPMATPALAQSTVHAFKPFPVAVPAPAAAPPAPKPIPARSVDILSAVLGCVTSAQVDGSTFVVSGRVPDPVSTVSRALYDLRTMHHLVTEPIQVLPLYPLAVGTAYGTGILGEGAGGRGPGGAAIAGGGSAGGLTSARAGMGASGGGGSSSSRAGTRSGSATFASSSGFMDGSELILSTSLCITDAAARPGSIVQRIASILTPELKRFVPQSDSGSKRLIRAAHSACVAMQKCQPQLEDHSPATAAMSEVSFGCISQALSKKEKDKLKEIEKAQSAAAMAQAYPYRKVFGALAGAAAAATATGVGGPAGPGAPAAATAVSSSPASHEPLGPAVPIVGIDTHDHFATDAEVRSGGSVDTLARIAADGYVRTLVQRLSYADIGALGARNETVSDYVCSSGPFARERIGNSSGTTETETGDQQSIVTYPPLQAVRQINGGYQLVGAVAIVRRLVDSTGRRFNAVPTAAIATNVADKPATMGRFADGGNNVAAGISIEDDLALSMLRSSSVNAPSSHGNGNGSNSGGNGSASSAMSSAGWFMSPSRFTGNAAGGALNIGGDGIDLGTGINSPSLLSPMHATGRTSRFGAEEDSGVAAASAAPNGGDFLIAEMTSKIVSNALQSALGVHHPADSSSAAADGPGQADVAASSPADVMLDTDAMETRSVLSATMSLTGTPLRAKPAGLGKAAYRAAGPAAAGGVASAGGQDAAVANADAGSADRAGAGSVLSAPMNVNDHDGADALRTAANSPNPDDNINLNLDLIAGGGVVQLPLRANSVLGGAGGSSSSANDDVLMAMSMSMPIGDDDLMMMGHLGGAPSAASGGVSAAAAAGGGGGAGLGADALMMATDDAFDGMLTRALGQHQHQPQRSSAGSSHVTTLARTARLSPASISSNRSTSSCTSKSKPMPLQLMQPVRSLMPADRATVRLSRLLALCKGMAAPVDASAVVSASNGAAAAGYSQIALTHARNVLLLHEGVCAEASRRRVGGLVIEASAKGLYRLAAIVAGWMPHDMTTIEGPVAINPYGSARQRNNHISSVSDASGSTGADASGQLRAPIPPFRKRWVPLVDWPFPHRVIDTMAPVLAASERSGDVNALSAGIGYPRYAVDSVGGMLVSAAASSSNSAEQVPLYKLLQTAGHQVGHGLVLTDAMLCGLQKYCVEGFITTPMGQRLRHPAAVLQFLTLHAQACSHLQQVA